MSAIKYFAAFIIVFYVAIGLLLFIFQRSFIYFPAPEVAHPYSVEYFDNGDVRLNVIVINPGQGHGVLYFGGNAESAAVSGPDAVNWFSEYTVYLVNYRGYGGSSGKPTEQGFYSDALFIYDSIANRHSELSVIGRSLGTGVATALAASRGISKMVLITPYDSIENIAKNSYPIYPIGLMLKDKYDSIGRVDRVTAPVLIVIAGQDQVIGRQYSDALIAAFPESQREVKVIPGAGHNTLSTHQDYYPTLQRFMR